MLIDTHATIAYKCSSCGSFVFYDISMFGLMYKTKRKFMCRCGKSEIAVSIEKSRIFKMNTPCMSCGNEHTFTVDRKEMLRKKIHVFRCPVTGMEQCFVGRDAVVRKMVDRFEQKLDELIDMFGYDSYFKNTQVMLDSLNRIHDLAEQGNLYCECGNSNIAIMLLPDRIRLKCTRCTGENEIKAASNEDLKDIFIREQILLIRGFLPYSPNETGNWIKNK